MQFIDLKKQRLRIKERLESAVLEVLESGQYILGPQVQSFERALAAYVGVKHVIACANGTDALLLPLMAYNISRGDAVFCPSFTFAASAEVIALAGADPVFIDIDPLTYNINVEHLELAIQEVLAEGRLQPKAIIAVDLFGLAADYPRLTEIAQRYGLYLIEDAAQSMGGIAFGQKCGSFGDVASTSFYPAKPLGCYGDGGAIFTNNDKLAAKLRSLAFHGKGKSQYDNIYIGINSRLDTIQAAILLEKLALLEEEMELRSAIAENYNAALAPFVKVPAHKAGFRSAYAQYTIETQQRDELRKFLHEHDIPTMIYYPAPLHLQEAYKSYKIAQSGQKASEALAKRVLSLPMHPYLTAGEQDLVINSIKAFFSRS